MMTSSEIRRLFLDFFKSKGHEIVPSAPIVIKNDPTLMFTNAGMNQFKDYFLGNRKPPFRRVADTQKCLRVSGKHNDLEEVGVDTYHHTMFEMLGNWSFGDYFKKEAIAWSWELLTKVYHIEPDRLYVTVFEGDEAEKLPKDSEVYAEWEKWIDKGRILMGDKQDNFWEMGDTGPCGPCSEIHVDRRSDEDRKKIDGHALVNTGHPEVVEIWNNVFIQFNRLKDGSLEPLPEKHVDTGMGLERLTCFLQNKESNYDTDIFSGTIDAVSRITGIPYGRSDSRQDVAFRVMADHIRAISFCVADGQLPSNNGAGYVVRRILRRAVRYYYSYLKYERPLLHQLMPVVALQFRTVFPELYQQLDFVEKVIREEEESFLRTIGSGISLLEQFFKRAPHGGSVQPTITGELAFTLSDTHGFPLDLTKLIAAEAGFAVDEKGFREELAKQKTRSRAAATVDAGDWTILMEDAVCEFVGYDSLKVKSKIVKYRKIKARAKEAYQLVLDVTPFYAESGGQVGDTGLLVAGEDRVRVMDTKKENNLTVHVTERLPIDLTADFMAQVDADKRRSTAIHHSATHLLHAALRQVLGTHVAQKGSLVSDEHLRFDFSHFAKVSEKELRMIEQIVNQKIRQNIPVIIREMPKDEALSMGAMALFGEKYGDLVRVVMIDPNFSVELCGGTHVGSTGDLGFFKIVHETAIAAGVRRIEALSGSSSEQYIEEQVALVASVRETLKSPKDLGAAVEQLLQENAELKRKVESYEARQQSALSGKLMERTEVLDGVNFIGEVVEVTTADALKKICFDLKDKLSDYLIVLAANVNGKAAVAIMVDEKILAARNLDASRMIKDQVAPLINGGGGGQKTLATAGGQNISDLHAVIEAVKGLIR